MRRSDREITDFGDIVDVISRCDTMHVAMNGDDYPYAVPLSFGYEMHDKYVTLYFHGAGNGLKHELLARDPHVCVEMSICHGFKESAHGGLTCEYESVIGFGIAHSVSGEEALKGLKLLNAHCGFADYDMGDCVPMTTVYAIDIKSITGKRRFVK